MIIATTGRKTETNSLALDGKGAVNVDDIIETVNHL